MENGSLSSIIKQCGTLNEELAAVYVAQVLKGLQYLHEQGVVHRDIKGANILTTKEVSCAGWTWTKEGTAAFRTTHLQTSNI